MELSSNSKLVMKPFLTSSCYTELSPLRLSPLTVNNNHIIYTEFCKWRVEIMPLTCFLSYIQLSIVLKTINNLFDECLNQNLIFPRNY